MFRSHIPLQTPIVIKLLLLFTLVISFVGWSVSSKTSGVEYSFQTDTVSVPHSE